MTLLKFANNASSRLQSAVNAAALTVQVQPGDGAKFPTLAAGEFFMLTLEDRRTGQVEITKCTARAVDILTVVRAQEGTVAQAFALGATASNRFTAGTMGSIASEFVLRIGDTMTGPLVLSGDPGSALVAAPKQYVDAAAALKEDKANKNAANGYAGLDSGGKVAAAQLPAYVDDVLEFANLAAFPATGSTGVIYVALDTNKVYRWGGSSYTEISPSPGSTDAVPEGLVNLYYTNARASAAAPVQSVAGRAGAVVLTKTDVGLGNVDNTSDVDKPVSTAQAAAIALKADLNSPVFTGNPTAPTPVPGDNDASIATTAFVTAAVTAAGGVSPSNNNPQMDGAVTPGASALYSRGDHVHPTDTSRASALHSHVIADVTGLSAALAGKEPAITAGTTSQFWRGDKAWVSLTKTDVGLGNVDNTSDANKPVSTAQQAALDTKADASAMTTADNLRVLKSGDTMTGPLILPGGSSSVTSLRFGGNANDGYYGSGAGTTYVHNFVVAGSVRLKIDQTQIRPNSPMRGDYDGTVSAPAFSWFSDPDSGWYRAGAGDIRLAVDGADAIKFAGGLATISGNPLVPRMSPPADSTTAWNSITTAGYFPTTVNGSNTNGPTPGLSQFFVVLVINHTTTGFYTQIAYPAWDASWGVWTRSCNSGVWSTWTRVSSTANALNRLVNPAFQISQENADTSSGASLTGPFYAADQWMSAWNVATGTMSSAGLNSTAAGVGGRMVYLTTNAAATLAATSYSLIQQFIEGLNVSDFGWGAAGAKQAVFRAWLFSNTAITIAFFIRNGALDRTFLASITLPASAWVERTVVIPGDVTGTWAKDNTTGINIGVCFTAGSTNQGAAGWQAGNKVGISGMTNPVALNSALYIAGAGLYLDPDNTGVAPEFELPDVTTETLRCQRYWQKTYLYYSGNVTSGSSYGTVNALPVTPRTTPTLSGVHGGGSGFPTTSGTLVHIAPAVVREIRTANATGNAQAYSSVVTADARL